MSERCPEFDFHFNRFIDGTQDIVDEYYQTVMDNLVFFILLIKGMVIFGRQLLGKLRLRIILVEISMWIHLKILVLRHLVYNH